MNPNDCLGKQPVVKQDGPRRETGHKTSYSQSNFRNIESQGDQKVTQFYERKQEFLRAMDPWIKNLDQNWMPGHF